MSQDLIAPEPRKTGAKAKTEKPVELAKLPGFSQGVRVNSAMRMVKLGAPICPNSQVTYEEGPDGKKRPKEKSPDDAQNCQLAGGEWWIACQELGHNPYFRTRVWYTKQDQFEKDEDPNSNTFGAEILIGQKTLRHEIKQPNIVQVAIAQRMNNGVGAQDSIRLKGRRRLAELGFEEVCQFRNCQKFLDPKVSNTSYGSYCSREHLQLIAADANSVMLPQISGVFEGPELQKVQRRRGALLRENLIGEIG